MRYEKQLKGRARNLRAKGKTYSEIKTSLKIKMPKSTLSNWCKDIILPKWYQRKIDALNLMNSEKARKLALLTNKIKREILIKQLRNSNKYLSQKIKDKDVLKIILAILYLAEGAKWKSHRGLMLGNTDPTIIKLYIRLLQKCYNIKPKNLKCRISYRADQNIISLQKYWSRLTSIPMENFYKTKPDPRTIGKPTKKKNYKGVCVLTCKGTNIQLELEMIPTLIMA